MIPVDGFSARKVAVLGLARSGLATVRALRAGGAAVFAWDDDADRRPAAADSGAQVTPLEAMPWAEMAALVLSPGIPLHHPTPHPAVAMARRHGVEIIGDIELFIRNVDAGQVVAITGTNGKSTTTALLGYLLHDAGFSVAVGGNLGLPVLDLPRLDGDGFYVLELSSYQLDLTPSLTCRAACLLNVTPDHLDRHGGMDGYIAAKRQIFRALTDDGVCVVGADDAPTRATADTLRAAGQRVVEISAGRLPGDGVFNDANQVTVRHNDQCRTLADRSAATALPGSHNGQNAAAAAALALDLGLADADIARGLLSFPGLAHRQERIRALNGVAYVNDSKATNAAAAARALACYTPIYWIAGGRAKDGGITALSAFFPRIRHAYLIGEAARDFARDLEGHAPYSLCGALPQAVDQAHHLAQAEHLDGATVLLAPAAASFDQFDSFEARGEVFRQQVMALDTDPPREAQA